MNLKEQMKLDTQTVFFNTEEFATLHTIDGKEMVLVMATDELNKRALPYAEGLYIERLLFYVKTKEFPKKPVEGKRLTIDGKVFVVASVIEMEELYEITVERNSA